MFGDTNPLRLFYHRMKGWAAAILFGFPARRLTVICVTGTDGKTTTVAMIAHILHESGKKVGAASSAFFEVNGTREHNPTQKTSLPPFALQKFLRRLVREECAFAVLEASSHGLLQGRLNGITPQVAAITNLSPEHLDYHPSMEAYLDAKTLLFLKLEERGTKVLNADDPSYEKLKDVVSGKTLTYARQQHEEKSVSLWLSNVTAESSSSSATLHAGSDVHELTLGIPGTFNLENALCAIACAESVGIPVEDCVKALGSFRGAPGRMERIDEGQPFSVYIDFTVTPVAYEKTLTSLRATRKEGARLFVLTGSCGDRMKEKRPLIGKICAELADIVIVTNEDPYTEDPEAIIDDVLSGIPEDVPVVHDAASEPEHRAFVARITDRLEAIRFCLRHAKPDDIVLFCGKGGDVTMWTKHGRIPWDEDAIVRAELRKIAKEKQA